MVGSSASPVPSDASLLILASIVGPVFLYWVVVVAGVGPVAMAILLWVPVDCHVILVVRHGGGNGGHNGKRNNNN